MALPPKLAIARMQKNSTQILAHQLFAATGSPTRNPHPEGQLMPRIRKLEREGAVGASTSEQCGHGGVELSGHARATPALFGEYPRKAVRRTVAESPSICPWICV